MKIGVLGTGGVGTTIATKLVELGHEVTMGSRTKDHEGAKSWAAANGDRAAHGTFADAARGAELLVNATRGAGSIDAIGSIDEGDLRGKVLIDISNALSSTPDAPPSLFVSNTDSLGETIQRTFPSLRVVKALNTVMADIMVNPGGLSSPTSIFMAGDDQEAKQTVRELLLSFGWQPDSVLDVGGISAARGLEAYLLFWLNLMTSLETPAFNVRVVR